MAISVQGPLHALDEIPREDAYAVKPCGRDAVVVAVADGLGTARASRMAASTVVDIVTGAVAEQMTGESPDWPTACDLALSRSSEAIKMLSKLLENFPAPGLAVLGDADLARSPEPATTLAVAFVKRIASGLQCHWLTVGDTECLELTPLGEIRRISHSEAQDFGPGTAAITAASEPARRMCETPIEIKGAVLLATDGEIESHLGTLAHQITQVAVNPRSIDISAIPGVMAALLTRDVPGSMDDATLAIISAVQKGER